MDKYACEMPRAMALNWLLSNPCDLTPLQLFTVGANLDNMNLCAEALRPCPDFKRLRDELNPRKLSLAQYQRIPPKFMWALNNAWGDVDDKTAQQAFKVQDNFKRSLRSGGRVRNASPEPTKKSGKRKARA